MCRAGGRRCKGGTGKATQATRKQRSRAKQALTAARVNGDPDAIAAATARLDAANAAHEAAKENAMRHHDNHDTADQSGDVTTPEVKAKPKPGPVTGALSDKPLLDNTWGSMLDNSPVHYHDDGPIGDAVKAMGQDAHMDVDGEPLANVVGKLATDVVRRRTTAQQAVNDLKELRDRLPEGSRAHRCVSSAVRKMDGPDTPLPQVPPGTPESLSELVGKLHAVPIVRQEPEREMQPLLKLCERAAGGDTAWLDEEVKRLGRKRHESLGDCGKFEIQDATDHAVKALREEERKKWREEDERDAAQQGDVTPARPHAKSDGTGDQGDVTTAKPAGESGTSTHVSGGGTVVNTVYGENHGVQMGNINGSLHFGPSGAKVVQAGHVSNLTQDNRTPSKPRVSVRGKGNRVSPGDLVVTSGPVSAGDLGDVTSKRPDTSSAGSAPNGDVDVRATESGGRRITVTGNGQVVSGRRAAREQHSGDGVQTGRVTGGVWVNGKRVQ